MGDSCRYLLAHFIWTTKNREPFIAPEIERPLLRYIARVCQDDGCKIAAINAVEDHVHLLLYLGPASSTERLMNRVKGASCRFILREYPEVRFGWQNGYGVSAVSHSHKQAVQEYIRNQKEHHAEGSLWSNVEEFDKAPAPSQLSQEAAAHNATSAEGP